MFNNKYTKWILASLLSTAGCAPSEFDSVSMALPELDTANSSMTVSGPSIADGISQTKVVLSLRSKKNKGIPGLVMSLTSSGTNNVIIPCTTSDSEGIANCWIMSTTAETKNLKASGETSLTGTAVFALPPPSQTLFSFVSAGGLQTAPSGHVFLTSVGIAETPSTLSDSSGFVRARTSHFSTMFDLGAL